MSYSRVHNRCPVFFFAHILLLMARILPDLFTLLCNVWSGSRLTGFFEAPLNVPQISQGDFRSAQPPLDWSCLFSQNSFHHFSKACRLYSRVGAPSPSPNRSRMRLQYSHTPSKCCGSKGFLSLRAIIIVPTNDCQYGGANPESSLMFRYVANWFSRPARSADWVPTG
jgi:hypothetical protein